MLFEGKMLNKKDQDVGVTTCVTKISEDNSSRNYRKLWITASGVRKRL